MNNQSFFVKNPNPLISIVIPAYNEQENISVCINSLLDQSYRRVEIILIDDGSRDKTIEVLSKFKIQNSKFKIYRQNHQGPAKARNFGVKKANGSILVFVDADMSFDKNFIKDLVSPIIEGKYKGTFSKEEYVSNWQNLWARSWNYNLNLGEKMIPDDYPDEGLDFRAILKAEFLKVGGFDDVGYTDTWTLQRKLGYKPHVAKGAKYYHANPDNIGEIFTQAKWVAKRKYKYGLAGVIFSLLRLSLPISIVVGLFKSVKHSEPKFLIFKIVYDLGSFLGILETQAFKKLSK